MGGQFIHYLPDYDLLFVTTADTQGLAGGNQLIYDALYDEILPFIQADPLPEDQKTHTELLSVLSSLAIAPLGDSAMTAAVTSQVSGKRYMFKPNSSEFTNFTADFTMMRDVLRLHCTADRVPFISVLENLSADSFPSMARGMLPAECGFRRTLYMCGHM